MSLGNRIKILRKQRGLSLADAARLYGGPRQQWHQWEQGNHTPNFLTLVRIAGALDTSLENLVADELAEPEAVNV